MLFNSLEFLFLFLPVVLVGYQLLQIRDQGQLSIAWLSASSLFFYGWWNPVYVPLILLSMLVNFSLGKRLSRTGPTDRWLLVTGIVFNLGLLGYFKYFNFFVDNINWWLETGYHIEKIILPLAISFYTFQQITYIVDSYKGLTKPHTMLEYSLFVTFFPQLIAGPIVHHSEMLDQFRNLKGQTLRSRNLLIGVSIIAIGMFKKVVVADGFSHFAIPVFDLDITGLNSMDVFIGLFAYTFQLYFDFSGYSDMAIGLACLLGIRLPVNFYSPYRAQNIGEFWRVWHATLQRFLLEYVFTPLGGFVRNRWRQRFNLLITMVLSGVWHGAGWTFVIFGFLHGFMVVFHRMWRTNVSSPRKWTRLRGYGAAMQVITFLAFALSLLLFRSSDLDRTLLLLRTLCEVEGSRISAGYQQLLHSSQWVETLTMFNASSFTTALLLTLLSLALLACWLLPNTAQLFAAQDVMLDPKRLGRPAAVSLSWKPTARWLGFTAVLLVISAMNLTEVSEFLYFQF